MLILVKKHLNTNKFTKKNQNQKKNFFLNFWPLGDPLRVASFQASGTLIENRLGASSNLAIWSMHAKFELIWTIRLPRAMGVVRKLNPHLIIGGNL